MSKKLALDGNGKSVIAKLVRNGLVTNEILQSTIFSGSRDAMRGVIDRLTDMRLIQKRPLIGKEIYYQLTTEGCRFAGVPEEDAEPFGPQAFPTRLAILLFSNPSNGPTRPRYTKEEFSNDFPEFRDRFDNYYLDVEGPEPRLGYIRVDLGGDYARIVRGCRDKLEALSEIPGLKTLIAESLFSLTIVTYDPDKADTFRKHLAEKPLAVPARVEVVPTLGKIITGTDTSNG